jgi:type II secretory pathway pseudopilin PulG
MVLHGHNERGYAMAAVLVAVAIMGILLSVAMPVWRHEARREKEAELVFRGEQYARAIALFRYKNANIPNVLPPSIDALVDGRFLRKKYKDPMTEDGEFVLIGMGSQQPGIQPGGGAPTPGFGGNTGGRGGNTGGRANTPTQPQTPQPNQPNMPVAGGMMGVRSKSTETSLRTYRGATRYDQWQFTFNIAPRPGGAMPMANSPDGRGGNPNMPPTVNPGGRNPGQRGTTFPPFNPGGRGPATPPGSGGRGPAGSRGRGM